MEKPAWASPVCALEAVRTVPGIEEILIFSDVIHHASDALHRLINESTARALVVAGMDTAIRSRLSRVLAAEAHRIRVIAIANERSEESVPEAEIRLAPLDRQDVERVLADTFPTISNERRWAIADLANGFLRVAIDICLNVYRLPDSGGRSSIFYTRERSFMFTATYVISRRCAGIRQP